MNRAGSVAMLVSAGSLLAIQVALVIPARVPQGAIHACQTNNERILAPMTLDEIIARFEAWKGTTCIPRLEKPSPLA